MIKKILFDKWLDWLAFASTLLIAIEVLFGQRLVWIDSVMSVSFGLVLCLFVGRILLLIYYFRRHPEKLPQTNKRGAKVREIIFTITFTALLLLLIFSACGNTVVAYLLAIVFSFFLIGSLFLKNPE